jgi:hypothetical protein
MVVACIRTLLLAGGNLADIDCIGGAMAISLHSWGVGIGGCARARVGVNDLLDLSVGEIGKL